MFFHMMSCTDACDGAVVITMLGLHPSYLHNTIPLANHDFPVLCPPLTIVLGLSLTDSAISLCRFVHLVLNFSNAYLAGSLLYIKCLFASSDVNAPN